MAELKGMVRNCNAKPFQGNQGPITLYSFQLEGDRRYFRCGTKQPSMGDGDCISFSFTEKSGNFNVDVGTIARIEATEVQAAPKPATSAGSASGGATASGANQGYASRSAMFAAKDAYWDAKAKRDINVVEPRINYSASQRDAVSLVTAALANDCLSFGSAAKGKKLDMLLDFVDQVTERFVAQREATGKED